MAHRLGAEDGLTSSITMLLITLVPYARCADAVRVSRPCQNKSICGRIHSQSVMLPVGSHVAIARQAIYPLGISDPPHLLQVR
jgi:hypothetical protein